MAWLLLERRLNRIEQLEESLWLKLKHEALLEKRHKIHVSVPFFFSLSVASPTTLLQHNFHSMDYCAILKDALWKRYYGGHKQP